MSNLDRCGFRASAALSLAAMWILFAVPVQAAPANPILVELFTSEGCSDCPPADAFLRALDSAQPIPGAQLIVLEEHVDYWDDQGWRDPFSSHALTLRQSEYVDRLHVQNGPYTPQMVVDGGEAFVGSDRAQAGRAFAKEVSVPKISVQISSLHVEGGKVLAHIDVGALPSKGEVFVAVALDHAAVASLERGEWRPPIGPRGGSRAPHQCRQGEKRRAIFERRGNQNGPPRKGLSGDWVCTASRYW